VRWNFVSKHPKNMENESIPIFMKTGNFDSAVILYNSLAGEPSDLRAFIKWLQDTETFNRVLFVSST